MKVVAPLLLLCVAAGLAGRVEAQSIGTAARGPVIPDFGPVFDIPSPDLATPTDHTYRVVFDVTRAAEKPESVNPNIESLARFLNMHARAGVPTERMQLALVLHGAAGKDALDNEGYRKRFGVDNPNLPLLRALEGAGVRMYLCGQTAMSRGLARTELSPQVKVALSAMTALAVLQEQGYRLVAF